MSDHDRSILARIEADGQEVPRIRLAAEDTADATIDRIETGKLRGTGRYEIHGEIATGGVGHILKAHDIDLGRDVALKVLREDHRGNRELVQRIVEEAQIGGQLQHPGIVPIYELGVAGGGRPYFVMKLIKGETLARSLAARQSPATESRRFLVVFEQICRTMAYAHSRGVIHRDLKPSNVMIGSFGEVQIVDWGFAKVLARGGIADERRAKQPERDVTMIATARTGSVGSNSIPGSVMGTPAYMPPEQALGQVDDLDERSDVFSLGAILTEVLTGKPPYVGAGKDLLTMAAQSHLEDAFERLDASGADEGLIDLAKGCLAAIRTDRPRNAEVLAERVSTHLADAEERVRRSEVSAIEARSDVARTRVEAAEVRTKALAERARAEEQRSKASDARRRAETARAEALESRRARRLGLFIASAVLVAILAAGGAWLWYEGSRSDRAHRATLAVNDALREGADHAAERRWDDADRAAERAVALAGNGAPAAVLVDAERFLGEVRSARSAALARIDMAKRDAAMLIRVAGIRGRGEDGLGDAFREYGIDLESNEAGGNLGRRAIALELAAALDHGALALPSDDVRRRRWFAVAAAADPDEGRGRLRGAALAGDEDALLALGESTREVPQSATLLGAALSAAGREEDALSILKAAWWRNPDDFWLNVELAGTLLSLDPARARHYTMAGTLRPDADWVPARLERCLAAGK